jgi:hypothetical protein
MSRKNNGVPRSSANWRANAPMIVAKHPQRPRRPGHKRGGGLGMTPDAVTTPLRMIGFGNFAKSFLAATAIALAGVSARYQKRSARGR